MLFYEYAFLGSALLTATTVFSMVEIETKNARAVVSSPSFTNDTVIEVIRNISRVNNALQELIQNYEQLQKIYKTVSFESGDDYSSDSEVDERYKHEQHKKKSNAKANTEKPQGGFPATQFTAFEDTVESSGTDDDTVEETKSEGSTSEATNPNRLPKIENLHAQSSPSKNEIKWDSQESSVSGEIVEKEKFPIHTTSTKKPQIIFIDTHKIFNNISKSAHRPQTRKEPIIILHEHGTTPRLNTRYKKVDHRSELRSGFHNDISFSINVNGMSKTNGSKKVAPAESFPREIMWDENSKNEPIKEDDAYFRTKTNKENEVIGSIPRPEKLALRKGPKESEPANFNKEAHKGNHHNKNSDSDSAAEDKELDKEIFKTHVLRQAYGDSCTKLVVRKCFKACKSVAKRTCTGSACKSSFKTAFEKLSKTGCIQQFDNSKNPARNKPSSLPLRTGGLNFPNDDYLTAACWPLLRSEQSFIPKRKLNLTSLKREEQLLVLRDRYEAACQSTMADKCIKACTSSFEAACKSSECPKKRESRFKKNCKRECRDVFKRDSSTRDADSGSGSSDSGSDSSGSGSDSDAS